MQPKYLRKFNTFAWICLFTCLAGVLYQLIHEGDLDHNSVIVGFPLGLVFGLLELYLFPKAQFWFGQWTFTKLLVVKALLYTTLIYIVTIALMMVVGWLEGRELSELVSFLGSTMQLILILYTLIIYSLLLFFLQINHLLGEGILWKFIKGKYHKPREEERIFMFLDMKSSTTIAEKLGHVQYYSLLNELFHEISQPVLATKAEIYQYVGDEVVLTWEMEQGLKKANCLKSFFLFREILLTNKEKYLKKYGVQPEFKAGLHCGKVISAQIGDLKREIVYNGDVLNTTARIQHACNQYGCDCLVSGILLNQLKGRNGFEWEKLDTVTLRGKETEVELFRVVELHPSASYPSLVKGNLGEGNGIPML